MKDSAARLQRLHVLRCRIAEAATVERERIAGEMRATEQTMSELRTVAARALEQQHQVGPSWRERQALVSIAAGQSHHFALQKERLAEAKEISKEQERAAVQAREQMGRMLERVKVLEAVEQGRREQARMDDLFATTRVRNAMATIF